MIPQSKIEELGAMQTVKSQQLKMTVMSKTDYAAASIPDVKSPQADSAFYDIEGSTPGPFDPNTPIPPPPPGHKGGFDPSEYRVGAPPIPEVKPPMSFGEVAKPAAEEAAAVSTEAGMSAAGAFAKGSTGLLAGAAPVGLGVAGATLAVDAVENVLKAVWKGIQSPQGSIHEYQVGGSSPSGSDGSGMAMQSLLSSLYKSAGGKMRM